MNGYGYQPKNRCNSCTKQNDCKKYKDGKEACKKYEGVQPKPPKAWTPPASSQTPSYTPPPMPEVKPPKQRTVLSVRDFAILYHIVNHEIIKMENQAQNVYNYMFPKNLTDVEKAIQVENNMKQLAENLHYQDLLRIREKLGELNIDVETPSVEVEE